MDTVSRDMLDEPDYDADHYQDELDEWRYEEMARVADTLFTALADDARDEHETQLDALTQRFQHLDVTSREFRMERRDAEAKVREGRMRCSRCPPHRGENVTRTKRGQHDRPYKDHRRK